jgi:hypothetical protein
MCHHPDYGCGQHFHHVTLRGWHHRWGCCCDPESETRCFPTREEIVEELEEHLKQLKAEAKGIEERIAELKKED